MSSTENEDDIFRPLPDILTAIEEKFNDNKELDLTQVAQLFDELKKYQNGQAAIDEFKWIFGIGEDLRHTVDERECRKVFLINFRKCAIYLQNFLLSAVKFE